jgi:apolipoprotein N-acyltransferase
MLFEPLHAHKKPSFHGGLFCYQPKRLSLHPLFATIHNRRLPMNSFLMMTLFFLWLFGPFLVLLFLFWLAVEQEYKHPWVKCTHLHSGAE